MTGPDLVEVRFAEGVAEAVVNIFVKAAGRYRAIPVDDGAVPQVATGVADFAFGREVVGSVIVAAEFLVRRQEGLHIGFGINLGCFEGEAIYAQFPSEFARGFNFVFVVFHDDKLQVDQGMAALQIAFCLYEQANAFEYAVKIAAHAVFDIAFGCDAVQRDHEFGQAGIDDVSSGFPVFDVVDIGAGQCGNIVRGGQSDHVGELLVDKGFALIPQHEEQEVIGLLLKDMFEVFKRHHAAFAGHVAIARGAERTFEVAEIGGFDHEHKGFAHANIPPKQIGEGVGCDHF